MQNKNKPLLLRPSGKDYLWGGSRLNDEFDEDGQSIFALVALAQILRMRSQHLCQLLPPNSPLTT